MPPLKDLKQEKFCQHLVKFGNREQAVVYAGYQCKTSKEKSSSASVQAARLLRDARVTSRLAELAEQAAGRMMLSKGRVLTEAARVAFMDPRKMFDPEGNLLPIHALDANTAAAIAGIEVDQVTKFGVNAGGATTKTVTRTSKVKLTNKVSALQLLAQHFGLLGKDPNAGQASGENHFHFYMPDNQRAITEPPILINGPAVIEQPPLTNGGMNGNGHSGLALPDNGRA